jgi:hypothetical protein
MVGDSPTAWGMTHSVDVTEVPVEAFLQMGIALIAGVDRPRHERSDKWRGFICMKLPTLRVGRGGAEPPARHPHCPPFGREVSRKARPKLKHELSRS